MRRLWAVLFCLLCTTPVWGAVTVDNVCTQGESTGTDPAAFNCTIAADANYLIGFSCIDNNTIEVSTWTAGATPLQRSTRIVNTASTNLSSEFWFLANPPTGVVSINLLNSGNDAWINGVISLKGVDSVTPFDTPVTAPVDSSGTAVSDAISSATGDLVLDVVCSTSAVNTVTVNGTQTTHWDIEGVSVDGAASSKAGAASVTMEHTLSGSGPFTHIVVNMNQAAAAGRRRVTIQ